MTDDQDHDDKGQFTSGNQAATKHGGAAAVQRIQRGEPLTGLAAQEEQQVKADLEEQGAAALMLENAVRLQTATRLYWNGVLAVADQGNLKMLNSYIKTFGWLAGASNRAWDQVRKSGGGGEDKDIVDAMKAAKEAKDNEQH